jgi:cation transport regulator ChaC
MTWVFGYGSLIWNPGFPYISTCIADVPGWARRFWQGSPDHRGTPKFAGRVVTVVEDPSENCTGCVFEIESQNESGVLKYLDIRESGGYQRAYVRCALESGETVTALTYIATPSNPNFLGDGPVEEIIQRILKAKGESGSNRDYVIELDEALREAGIVDSHVAGIASRVRRMIDGLG